jgi:hypothetical protein
MTPARGQILRRIGLVIEVVCVVALLNPAPVKVEVWRRFGVDPIRPLWIGLAIGFALWITGTAAIFAGRKRQDDR